MTEATVTQALEPCPFCGGESWAVNSPVSPSIAIMCRSCGATGGLRDTEAEAIAAWNTRTAASQASDAGEDVIERMARALFVFQHQGDIDNPGQVWDAPDKGLHPIYWVQRMEHNRPHYRAMARAALATLSPTTSGEEMRMREHVRALLEELDKTERRSCKAAGLARAALTKGAADV